MTRSPESVVRGTRRLMLWAALEDGATAASEALSNRS